MKIERMNKGSWGKLRAFFDIKTEEGIVIKGFKLVEGINGLFVGMPSQKGKDEEFFDTVFMEKDVRDKLNDIAIEQYNSQYTETLTQPDSAEIKNDNNQSDKPKEETEEDKTQEAATATSEAPNQPFSDDDIPF